MTSRELRNQRREQERKARKLAYRQSRSAAAETCGAGSLAGEPVARPADLTLNPDLLDEFSAHDLAEMMAIRARVHARAAADAPESGAERPVRMPVPRPASAPSKDAKTQVDEPAILSEAKIQKRSGSGPGPTGPTTPEGKATCSGNSLKHGLASGRVIIPGEDPAEFEALLSDLIKEHAPSNETESLLVQQMAQSWWLMQRAIRIQNEAFTENRVDTHKLALFLRYQTTYERAFYRALNTLLKLSRTRGVRSTSASALKEAVSSRHKSAPEFVSQKLVGATHASPISQETVPNPQFVSQNAAPTRP